MTEPTMHEVNRFVGTVSAACVEREWNLVRSAFNGMTDAVAEALAVQVSHYLRDHADIAAWTEAAYHLPAPGRRAATRKLGEHLDEAIRAGQPAAARAAISKEAFRLLRAGTGSHDLVDRLQALNATLPGALDRKSLDDLIVWVAQSHFRGVRRAG